MGYLGHRCLDGHQEGATSPVILPIVKLHRRRRLHDAKLSSIQQEVMRFLLA